MSTYRLIFDIELPDDISNNDKEEFENWLNYFNGCIENDIYIDNPLNCDIDVNSNLEEI